MRFLCFAFFLLTLALVPLRADAQNALLGYSTTEKVGFAFYHLINKDPPVEEWIAARDDYLAAKPNVQIDIMKHDRLRLREGFANFFVNRDLITLTVPLLFDVGDNPDYKTDMAAQTAGLKKRVQIKFPPLYNKPYFPFQLGKMWIGLIPEDLETLFRRDMTMEEYKTFCEGIRDCSDFKNHQLQTIIVMKPTKADVKEPMMDGDLPIWLMLADIGAMYVQINNKPIDWKYIAPWYDAQQAQQLMTLYDK